MTSEIKAHGVVPLSTGGHATINREGAEFSARHKKKSPTAIVTHGYLIPARFCAAGFSIPFSISSMIVSFLFKII